MFLRKFETGFHLWDISNLNYGDNGGDEEILGGLEKQILFESYVKSKLSFLIGKISFLIFEQHSMYVCNTSQKEASTFKRLCIKIISRKKIGDST